METREAIVAVSRRLAEALGQRDAAGAAALYSADARLLPPNAPPFVGRGQIEQFWASVLQMGLRDASLTTEDVQADGDLACETGTYRMTLGPADQPIRDEGKFVVLWQRQPDGEWRATVDIWNSSLPALSP